MEDSGPYRDIISLPHHVSRNRPRMSLQDRAAQFSPFAALTGFGAAIRETARLTQERIELGEDARADLDQKLRLAADTGRRAAITFFLPDARKAGGAYRTCTGAVKRLDLLHRTVVLTDGTAIPADDILELDLDGGGPAL